MSSPIRFDNWPTRLREYLDAVTAKRFKYGEFDCCLFCSDAVLAMTGTDLAADIRGTYRSRRELRESGIMVGDTVIRILDHHGVLEIPPAFAGRGDLVLLKRPRDHSMGIIDFSGRVLIAARIGWGKAANPVIEKAWRV